jgi:hypothetical protein
VTWNENSRSDAVRVGHFTCEVRLLARATFSRDRMSVRGAPVGSVRRILKPKPTWSPSISQSKGRNLLPSFSHIRTQAQRDRDTLRFRVLASSNSPLLRRHCSFHHSPLDDLSAAVMPDNASDHYRLPTEVRPRHYDLTIRTNLEKEKFTGFVKIECVRRLFSYRGSQCSNLLTAASKS